MLEVKSAEKLTRHLLPPEKRGQSSEELQGSVGEKARKSRVWNVRMAGPENFARRAQVRVRHLKGDQGERDYYENQLIEKKKDTEIQAAGTPDYQKKRRQGARTLPGRENLVMPSANETNWVIRQIWCHDDPSCLVCHETDE